MLLTLALVSCGDGCNCSPSPPQEDLPPQDPDEEQVTIDQVDAAVVGVPAPKLSWPFGPTDEEHPLLTQHAQYMQANAETPRLHHGIDVLAPEQDAVANRLRVYAVASGFVTYIHDGGTYDTPFRCG